MKLDGHIYFRTTSAYNLKRTNDGNNIGEYVVAADFLQRGQMGET
jgi:hypothetical protein